MSCLGSSSRGGMLPLMRLEPRLRAARPSGRPSRSGRGPRMELLKSRSAEVVAGSGGHPPVGMAPARPALGRTLCAGREQGSHDTYGAG